MNQVEGFLIDNDVSPSIVAMCHRRGYAATHASFLNMAAASDLLMARKAIEMSYVFVTSNRTDFLKLYDKLDIHPGLVVVIPKLRRDAQVAALETIVDYIEENELDMIDMLLEVSDDLSIHPRRWTRNEHDVEHIVSPTFRLR